LFYFISYVQPSLKFTGGEIVLHRHFVERKDFDFTIIDIPIQKPKWIQRLETTRFRSYILALQPFYTSYDISVLKNMDKPNFIVTVAHDRHCYAAAKVAAYWNVPLVTIFHDWFPASSGAHPRFLSFLNQEFKRLYRQSALALCVCEQMMLALGKHVNAIVLPPIPSSNNNVSFSEKHNIAKQVPTILYAGFCGGAYKSMLQRFVDVANEVQVVVSGPHSTELKTQNTSVHLAGFLEKEAFATIFEDADILLVLLNFNPQNRLHFSTHFPSKLVEYVGKGKMIAIWGPEYCTAVQWAKQTGAAFYFEEENATAFYQSLLEMYADEAKRNLFISNARKVYEQSFSPVVIDALLKQKLNELVC